MGQRKIARMEEDGYCDKDSIDNGLSNSMQKVIEFFRTTEDKRDLLDRLPTQLLEN